MFQSNTLIHVHHVLRLCSHSVTLPFPVTHPLSYLMRLKIDSGQRENVVFVFLSLAYFAEHDDLQMCPFYSK